MMQNISEQMKAMVARIEKARAYPVNAALSLFQSKRPIAYDKIPVKRGPFRIYVQVATGVTQVTLKDTTNLQYDPNLVYIGATSSNPKIMGLLSGVKIYVSMAGENEAVRMNVRQSLAIQLQKVGGAYIYQSLHDAIDLGQDGSALATTVAATTLTQATRKADYERLPAPMLVDFELDTLELRSYKATGAGGPLEALVSFEGYIWKKGDSIYEDLAIADCLTNQKGVLLERISLY